MYLTQGSPQEDLILFPQWLDIDSIVQRNAIDLLWRLIPRVLRGEGHLCVVVRVRPNLELALLGVQGELVETHRANEGDVCGLEEYKAKLNG